MSSPLVILILSLLLGLQPITTDLYLPALPALTASFGAVPAQAQLTLTALLLAFGASQLFWWSEARKAPATPTAPAAARASANAIRRDAKVLNRDMGSLLEESCAGTTPHLQNRIGPRSHDVVLGWQPPLGGAL